MHPILHERFWITIVAKGSPDTTWGSYQYVPDGAKSVEMHPATAGDFEIRLHGNYPTLSTHVVDRHAIHVDE